MIIMFFILIVVGIVIVSKLNKISKRLSVDKDDDQRVLPK